MAKKTKRIETDNEGGLALEALATRPKKVAIVGLGSSCGDFIREMIGRGSAMDGDPYDEVWCVNRGLRAIAHDKLFVMDDLRWIEKKDKHYAGWLKKHDKPIITSTPYADFPMAIAYPLHEVMDTIKDDIFTVNTIAYMTAYAMHIKSVEELAFYGCDFFYPDGNKSEEGGQAIAYLLGMATGMGMIRREIGIEPVGMKHKIPNSSTLLYANKARPGPGGVVFRPPYGYHRKEEMKKNAA